MSSSRAPARRPRRGRVPPRERVGTTTRCSRPLSGAGAALCIADDEERSTPVVATAGFGYLRLRRPDYDDAALARWAETVLAQRWDDAFVYFKHEDEARGPAYALRFTKLVGS